jgi:RNA polymerase sigma-70 factor, ECF subfamily
VVMSQREEFEQDALPLMNVLYAGALRLTRNAGDAEDLVQDTYVRAFERFNLYKPGTNLKAWMFRIMTNRFINLYRRRKARPDGALMEDMSEMHGTEDRQTAEDFQAANEVGKLMQDPEFLNTLDDRLKQGLESLAGEYQQVLVMNVIGEMPYKDIASELEIPIGTVMSRLSRARTMLKEKVAELGAEEIPGVAKSSTTA